MTLSSPSKSWNSTASMPTSYWNWSALSWDQDLASQNLEVAWGPHQEFHNPVPCGLGFYCHRRKQGLGASQKDDILWQLDSTGLLVFPPVVGGQLFSSPGDHSLGKISDHPVNLQKIQSQQSLVTDIGNQDIWWTSFSMPRTLIGESSAEIMLPSQEGQF